MVAMEEFIAAEESADESGEGGAVRVGVTGGVD